MPTPVTVSTYDGIANSNMGFCLPEALSKYKGR
jgi:hypothetical protein